MIYQVGICDDEPFMQKINRFYAEEIAEKLDLQLNFHVFSSGEELLQYVSAHELHITFLDIDMGGMSGLETAEHLVKISKDTAIIFATSHNEFALNAFEVDAVGYLVKPYELDKMEKALKKAITLVNLKKNRFLNKAITITEENMKIKIQQRSIVTIEKEGNQCIIYQADKMNRCYSSIKKMMEGLEDYFWQIGEGVIVNSKYIKTIEGSKLYMKQKKSSSNVEGYYKIGRKFLPIVKEKYYKEVI